MKAEKKTENIQQFSIVMNKALNEQLEYLANKRQQTKAKIIKRLINDSYMDNVTSQR